MTNAQQSNYQKAISRLHQIQLGLSQSETTPQHQAASRRPNRMKLLYPTSLKLNTKSLEGFGVDLVAYDVKKTLPEDAIDAECLVTWCNSSDNLKDAAGRMKKLRWIQSLAAGPNDVLNAGFSASEITICTGSGLHDHTVAEHALGLLLNSARRFFEMRDYQLQGKWPGHLGGPQPDRPAGKFTTLRDARVLIWGFGNIGKTLAPWLTALGAQVRGVARHAGVRDGVEVYGEDKLPELLPETDALVMILPGSEATKHVLNAERLKQLPNHAWIVNVGRGTSVDDEALLSALEKEEIGGAALDVFTTEPLPENSPYWKQKNVVVSPHAAGGRERKFWSQRTYVAFQPDKA
ncbi:uncharacterized protein LTR77_003624 [Saxophila tyrrhenica]|uniref:D-isomer specific 2-hydroxyacid dehydrogenase NAD-binding domain-containing protein n=1 Tax=Saxophila tyrrhenica TaxID=1690608 RepID=A0AAV9PI59_9PEZI|nr:hypothetical protein LTR77_003624 [Saxophila tyrrhenica]